MTRRNVRKQGWVFPLVSPDSDDQLSLNFHRFVILYISCDTQSVGLGQYSLPKVSNGFNHGHTLMANLHFLTIHSPIVKRAPKMFVNMGNMERCKLMTWPTPVWVKGDWWMQWSLWLIHSEISPGLWNMRFYQSVLPSLTMKAKLHRASKQKKTPASQNLLQTNHN